MRRLLFLSLIALLATALVSGVELKSTNEEVIFELRNKIQSQQVVLDRLQLQLNSLERKFAAQQEIIERQQSQILQLESKWNQFASPDSSSAIEQKMSSPRTCMELHASDPSKPSGIYYLDPDGVGVGDSPIEAYCDMATGSTSIAHDSQPSTQVDSCHEPGCYSVPINYTAPMKQMALLIRLSTNCRQYFQFDCLGVPLQFDGINYAWWNGRNSNVSNYYWAGSHYPDYHTCSCDDSCLSPSLRCNCDSSPSSPSSDQGYISNKDALPVTRLNFGRTSVPSTYGRYTLGKLECNGQIGIDRMPKSCDDLWLMGHTLSGFYSVKGRLPLSVYCDFFKILQEQGKH